MSGTLNHSPAKIILELMITAALGTRFSGNDAWPIYYNYMPDTNSEGVDTNVNQNCLAVYDTTGQVYSRNSIDGRFNEDHGVMVKVRCKDETTGWSKSQAIKDYIDRQVIRTQVTISSSTYTVHCLTRTGDIMRVGPRPETRSRELTLNYLATITINP